MADITYIPIRQLYPHPDNPRKELGDLSELAASIKENGVYQNLTVIPGHYLNSREYIAKCVDEGGDAAAAAAAWTPKAVWSSEDYTIIIGHRRAAAAQQAGLYELPCAIVEMDEREQMQTMMIENMQRSDLTVYEQAQGFQMMMDFGQTVEQISDKSWFSQSTIRRRIKLLELNRDSFKKAEKRGATLSDFAQLDKIEDLEARNRVLETLGTQNFNRAMQDALEQQKWQHQKAEWVEQLKKFATEDSQASYQTHEHVNAYGKWSTKKEVVMPEDADQAVTWTSSDPSVASVDENGWVKAVGEGTATITATVTSDPTLTATCEVSVSEWTVESLTLDVDEETIKVGEQLRINATVLPTEHKFDVDFYTSNAEIATVTIGGLVTGVAVGDVTITAKAGTKEATALIHVEANEEPKPDDQAIDDVNAQTSVQKSVRDGQVYILRNGVLYTVTGAEVRE